MNQLPPEFLNSPIAHRAYHNIADGRPENSIAAIRAAIDAGYGIEIDIQMSQDCAAIVFHDYSLDRLTLETGLVADRTAAELTSILLKGSEEAVPTLAKVLDTVKGRVPLLIEIKDQDGQLGPNVGALEKSVISDLAEYSGPVALMSFNPHSVAELARLAPHIPRGITTCAYLTEDWPGIPQGTLDLLKPLPDVQRTGSCFISHEASDLGNPAIAPLRKQGLSILCWTIRSQDEETRARAVADNVTFERYPAVTPSA